MVRSTELTRFRLAPNPGPMSLHGTNSYVIAAPGAAGTVVVDPGPLDEPHLQELARAGDRRAHPDHAPARGPHGRRRPVRRTDRRARARQGSGPLPRREAPWRTAKSSTPPGRRSGSWRRRATPRTRSASTCPHDGARGSVLTGDTILGLGTTVLDYPDGTLGDYLASLDRLEQLGAATVLPAHGPMLPALDTIVRAYRDHREDRLAQIRTALDGPGRRRRGDRSGRRRVRRRRPRRPARGGTLRGRPAALPAPDSGTA